MIAFLFGSGPWRILYILMYVWYFFIPGMMVNVSWGAFWSTVKMGGAEKLGPGALGIGILALVYCATIIPVLLISSILFAFNQDRHFLYKIIFVIAVGLLIPLFLGGLSLYMENMTYFFLCFFGYYLMFFINLLMMKAVRA